MNVLPVCIFTKDRTGCACATVESVLKNLSCSGRRLRWVLCDDMSVKGHLDAVLRVFDAYGAVPSLHVMTPARHGLGASMNIGLEDAFRDSDKCLRMEDDWLLKRPLDIGPWVDAMDRLKIGSLRLGMMFRKAHELRAFDDDPGCGLGLLKVCSAYRQRFTFNNQLAVIGRTMYDLVGRYPENAGPPAVEKYAADRYNRITGYGSRPPYVAWPRGWDTQTHYGDRMAFDHIGVSISGHAKMYRIPQGLMKYNDPERDRTLRAGAVS